MVVHQLCGLGFSQQGYYVLGFAESAPVGWPCPLPPAGIGLLQGPLPSTKVPDFSEVMAARTGWSNSFYGYHPDT